MSPRSWKALDVCLLPYLALACFWAGAAPAQVVLDGSTGGPSAPPIMNNVPDSGGVVVTYLITDEHGTRSGGGTGSTLFFGFSQFDVAETEIASFDPAPDFATNLILARVHSPTGAGSLIEGTLRSQATDARVVLLNPSGVTISGSARLDLSGSLMVGTPDEVRFVGGEVLDLGSSSEINIVASTPSEFGFYGDPGVVDITVGSLALAPTAPGAASPNTLSFIGNEVRIRGDSSARELRANGGRVELAAVPNDTAVPYSIDQIAPETFAPGTGGRVEVGDSFDQVNLTAGSVFLGDESPGRIVIRGGQVVLENAMLSTDNWSATDATPGAGVDLRAQDVTLIDSVIRSSAFGDGSGAPIEIAADALRLDQASRVFAQATNSGPGGSIEIGGLESGSRADRVSVLDASAIDTGAAGEGDAGGIRIRADVIEVSDFGSVVASTTEAMDPVGSSAGAAGEIDIETRQLLLTGGGRIDATTTGDGDAGALLVRADELVRIEGVGRVTNPNVDPIRSSLNSTSNGGSGNAGSIRVEAPLLELLDGAQISASSFGLGDAGDAGSILLTGLSQLTVEGGAEGDSVIAVANRDGAGGELRVEADRVDLRNGGRLRTTTNGSQAGGDLIVDARTLTISGRDPVVGDRSGLFAVSTVDSTAEGGRIEVLNADRVSLSEGAEISATASGAGDAGRIDFVRVDRIELASASRIRTDSFASLGGNIDLDARESVVLRGGSEITTSVANGAGQGGNIDLETRVLALERSRIRADADLGNGGNITARALLISQSGPSPDAPNEASRISASSTFATDGDIEFATPEAELVATLAPLAEERLQDLPLRSTPCAVASSRSDRSRLVIGSSAGLRPGPEGWLPSWARAVERAGTESDASGEACGSPRAVEGPAR